MSEFAKLRRSVGAPFALLAVCAGCAATSGPPDLRGVDTDATRGAHALEHHNGPALRGLSERYHLDLEPIVGDRPFAIAVWVDGDDVPVLQNCPSKPGETTYLKFEPAFVGCERESAIVLYTTVTILQGLMLNVMTNGETRTFEVIRGRGERTHAWLVSPRDRLDSVVATQASLTTSSCLATTAPTDREKRCNVVQSHLLRVSAGQDPWQYRYGTGYRSVECGDVVQDSLVFLMCTDDELRQYVRVGHEPPPFTLRTGQLSVTVPPGEHDFGDVLQAIEAAEAEP